MDRSDKRRLSVSLIDLSEGHETEFDTISTHFQALLLRKEYGRAELFRDEGSPLRFYSIRYWASASAAPLSGIESGVTQFPRSIA